MDIADLYNMLSFRYGFLDDSELKDELVKLVTDGISPYSLPDIYAVSGYMNIKPSEAVNILNIDNSESVNTFKALDASVEDKTYCEMIYDAVKYVEEVEYTYNSANLLSTLKQGDIVSYKYTYIPNGNISDIDDYVNNLHTRYSYSGRNQLVSEISRNTETNSITNNISYEYDAAGNRIYINCTGYESEYIYDANNRLITEKRDNKRTEDDEIISYQYDKNGNRIGISGAATTYSAYPTAATTYTYDAFNRLTQISYGK